MILVRTDFENFKTWLDLDIDSIAWEGRNAESFNDFWNSFFKERIQPQELSQRFNYAKKIAKSGPLISWMTWLFEKFIVYCFVHQEISVRELSLLFDLEEKVVSTVLRDHLIKVYSSYEDLVNEKFQISNVSSENLYMTFSDIRPILGDEVKVKGTFEDDILASMEVTLYPDWPNLVKELSKDIQSLSVDFDHMKKKVVFRKQLGFVQEVIFLLLILSVIVFALKNSNKWYEEYLVNKITLFEPNFSGWISHSLTKNRISWPCNR
jgi:hypothetical protein